MLIKKEVNKNFFIGVIKSYFIQIILADNEKRKYFKKKCKCKNSDIKNIVEKEKLDYGINLSMNNLNCSNPRIKFIPLYMTMFIRHYVK